MSYEELVCKIKKAYLDKDLKNAHKYWCEMYDLLDSKLNETDDEVKRYEYYKEFNSYMDKFSNDEVYDITDYGKKQAYRQMEIERTYNILDKSVKLYDLTKDEKMKSLDDFLSFYEWCILKNEEEKNKYDIYDLQTNENIENNISLNEVILRLVERALCYELDEHSEDLDDKEYDEYYNSKYIQDLLDIQEEYIEKRKEELTKELEYEEKRLDYCAYGKSDLYNIEHLKYKIENLNKDYERWR